MGLQEREGEEDHITIKAMLACVWGSHIGNTSVPSLDSTCFITLHVLYLNVFTHMLTSYIIC